MILRIDFEQKNQRREALIMNLFDEFPSLSDDKIIIGKMSENDVGSLEEITENANVYRYIPPFLYRKKQRKPSCGNP